MGMDAVIVIVRKTFQMITGVDVVFVQSAVVLTFQITLNVTIWIVMCRNTVLQGGTCEDLAVVSVDLHNVIVVVWFVGTNRGGGQFRWASMFSLLTGGIAPMNIVC